MEVRNLERNREIYKNDEYESKPQRNTTERSAKLSSTFAAYAEEDNGDKRDTASPGFGARLFSRGSGCHESESWTQNHSRPRQVDRI